MLQSFDARLCEFLRELERLFPDCQDPDVWIAALETGSLIALAGEGDREALELVAFWLKEAFCSRDK